MATASFNGTVIAESSDTVIVEGNHYFPIDSVVSGVLVDSDRTSVCPWKGTASYYDVVVDGETAAAAAWYYPEPKQKAAHIKDRVAFYPVVTVDACSAPWEAPAVVAREAAVAGSGRNDADELGRLRVCGR